MIGDLRLAFERGAVLRLVLWQGVRLALAGIAVGVVASAGVGPERPACPVPGCPWS